MDNWWLVLFFFFRFGFYCCYSNSYKVYICLCILYENVWDGDFDYKVEFGKYLVGVYSYYDN